MPKLEYQIRNSDGIWNYRSGSAFRSARRAGRPCRSRPVFSTDGWSYFNLNGQPTLAARHYDYYKFDIDEWVPIKYDWFWQYRKRGGLVKRVVKSTGVEEVFNCKK